MSADDQHEPGTGPTMNFCIECGERLGGGPFCPGCGVHLRPLDSDPDQPAANPDDVLPAETPLPVDMPPVSLMEDHTGAARDSVDVAPSGRSRMFRRTPVIVTMLVVLVVAVGTIIAASGGSDNTPDTISADGLLDSVPAGWRTGWADATGDCDRGAAYGTSAVTRRAQAGIISQDDVLYFRGYVASWDYGTEHQTCLSVAQVARAAGSEFLDVLRTDAPTNTTTATYPPTTTSTTGPPPADTGSAAATKGPLSGVDWANVISDVDCTQASNVGLAVTGERHADVTDDGIADAVVWVRCATSHSTWTDQLEVFDGSSSPAAPKKLAVLVHAKDSLNIKTVSAGDRTVTVSGVTWADSDPNCCPSLTVQRSYSWNGTALVETPSLDGE